MADVREITRSAEILERRAISSSVIPSAKYSCFGSCERFSSGRTASDLISGRLVGAAGLDRAAPGFQRTIAPARSAIPMPAAAIQYFRRPAGRGATAAVILGC